MTGDGPVWICSPLEAVAIIGLGLPAIGYTGGESARLPDGIISLVKSAEKLAALPPDDDKKGDEWGVRSKKQFADAAIDARIVNLDLDAAAGLKDIGDWIVRERIENARTVEAMRESLLHAYEVSDPWRKFTLSGIMASPETWRPVTYIKTGLPRWDKLAGGGLRTRGVHLIPGKPGQGKSTLAVQVATNAALAGVPVGIVSLEMTREDLAKLVVAQNTGIPRRVLDSGRFGDGYSQPFNDFKSKSAKMPLTILDDDHWQGPLDREGLASLVAEGVSRFGWKLVVLDYLGLLAPVENDQGNFDTELRNSSALKRMASKFDIALLVVAALRKFRPSRKAGEASKVTLDDVSGAGRLTYDCTSCWYVESEQQPTSPPSGTIWLHALKARFSGVASLGEVLELRWAPHTGQVSDLRYHE